MNLAKKTKGLLSNQFEILAAGRCIIVYINSHRYPVEVESRYRGRKALKFTIKPYGALRLINDEPGILESRQIGDYRVVNWERKPFDANELPPAKTEEQPPNSGTTTVDPTDHRRRIYEP